MGTEGGEDTQDNRLKPGCGLADQAEMMNCKHMGKNKSNQANHPGDDQNMQALKQKYFPEPLHVGLQ